MVSRGFLIAAAWAPDCVEKKLLDRWKLAETPSSCIDAYFRTQAGREERESKPLDCKATTLAWIVCVSTSVSCACHDVIFIQIAVVPVFRLLLVLVPHRPCPQKPTFFCTLSKPSLFKMILLLLILHYRILFSP